MKNILIKLYIQVNPIFDVKLIITMVIILISSLIL